ncbi:MAG: hypothetical protein AB1465_02605 [Patescibacteria group bacterium]
MHSLKEQFFAEEFSRIYQRQRRKKQRRDLKLKEKIKKELAILQEKENQKKFWWKISLLRKLSQVKNQTKIGFQKNKKSDNLASQIALSNIEYMAPAESDEEEPQEEASEEKPTGDFDKVRAAGRAAEAIKTAEQKKLQHERAFARTQKLAQQVKRIKTALHAAKIGSAAMGAASLGITVLVTILIWIGQFIGRYILEIELIPGFDWLDYLLMAVVVMIIALIVLPIVVFMSTLCRLDIFGLVC